MPTSCCSKNIFMPEDLMACLNTLNLYKDTPSEGAKKHFRTPRIHHNNSSPTSDASQGEMASQARKHILSPFNKFTLTSLKSPVFCTPPMNPFVEDELQLNGEGTGIIVSIKLPILLQLIEFLLTKKISSSCHVCLAYLHHPT